MREVQYMTDLEGKRVAVVPQKPKRGYEFNGVVYDTAIEASRAEGALNQAVYFDERYDAALDALKGVLSNVCPSPTYHWEDQEEQREKNSEVARGIMDALFPGYRARTEKDDHYAVTFLDELAKAEAVYREMRP